MRTTDMRIDPAAARPNACFAGVVVGLMALLALSGGSVPAHAEPILLHGAERHDVLLPTEGEWPAGLPPVDGDPATVAAPPALPALPVQLRAGESESGTATASDAAAPAARHRSAAPRPALDQQIDKAAGHNGELSLAPPALDDAVPSWEREIGAELKEIVRPVYNELAAAGVLDAVQGIKSYLDLHEASSVAARNGATPGAHDGRPQARRAGDDDDFPEALGAEKSAAQIEKQRMITALLIDEWVTALKPWFFALIACYLLWQLIVLGFKLLRWKTRRARKRVERGRRSRRQGQPTR